jgi:hypothetical protein
MGAKEVLHMRIRTARNDAPDVILASGEADAAFAAWTLEELEDDLDSLRSAFADDDDAGG